MPDDFVTVPPGHKVVVVHPVLSPSIGRGESGVVIVDLGAGSDFEPVASAAGRFVVAAQQAAMIWILQEALLARVADWNQVVARLEQVVCQPGSGVAHCVVLGHEAARRLDLIQRLKDLGMDVHGSDDDGACFVEVHRPDGIVVGMPGPEL